MSCSLPEYNQVPADVLSENKMQDILKDIHLAEGYLSINPSPGDSNLRKAKGFYELIYKKHGVTETDFQKSMDYYCEHPVLLDSVYSKLIINLSEMETNLRK